ncbi:response regulator PleD [compost metagenome]
MAAHHIRVGSGSDPVSVTVSIGGLSIEDFEQEQAGGPSEGALVQLLARVDKALYQAKEKGRNRVEFVGKAS